MFIGLVKTFDNISHNQLLNILKCVGVVGNPFDLVDCYLKNRKRLVGITSITLSDGLVITNTEYLLKGIELSALLH